MDDLEKQLMDLSGIKEPEKPVAPPVPSVVTDTDYGPAHKSGLAPVRTFSSDLANAVREHGGSVVRVAIAEEEKHRREYEDVSIKSKKNIIFIVIGLVLVLGGIGAFVWSYQYRQAASVVVPVADPLPDSLVASDAFQTIDIAGMQTVDLYTAVRRIEAAPGIETGQIKNIVITRGPAARPAAADFLRTLGTHMPDGLSRALSNDFMLGTYRSGDTTNLFLVVHGTAHDFLLAGMLAWEPYLFNDLVPLFGIDTSALTKAELQNMTFSDAVIGNRDARAVLDANKKPMLYYSFLDPNTIFFATDPKTLTQAIAKF